MADSPSNGADGPVEVEIRSNGSKLPDTVEILAVRTRSEFNRVSEAMIVFADGNAATQEFNVADSDKLVPGAEIQILAGYAGKAKTIFKGIVVSMRLRIDGTGQGRLEVGCRHKAVSLLDGPRRSIYENKTDSDVISSILRDAGISADVAATSVTNPTMVRPTTTDWDYLVNRAEINGLLVACTDGGVAVKKPEISAKPLLTVTFGEDLIAFDAEISARGQYEAYSASGWDPSNQQMVTEQGKTPEAVKISNVTAKKLAEATGSRSFATATAATHVKDVLKEAASARALRAELARLQGRVTFQGNAAPRLNTTLELSGLGDRFSGTGLVCGVVQRIEAGSWQTEVQLGLPAAWIGDRGRAPADLGPPMRGLAIGTVKSVGEDDDGLFRVQLSLPGIDEGAASIFARLATPYASKDAGILFPPEVNDEVIVGFLADDPDSAAILGAVHYPASKPSFEMRKDNNIKSIVTRSKLIISFDDENKVLTCETPEGNKMVLSDDDKSIVLTDQTGNKVLLNSSGITLDSPKDVTIKAAGKVSISATGDMTASGMNVDLGADVTLSAKGGASAELSASGNTTVKGAIVMIN